MASRPGSPFRIHSPRPRHRTSPYPTSLPTNSTPIGCTATGLPSTQTTLNTPLQNKLATLITALKGVKSGLKGLPPVQLAIDGLAVCLTNMQIREQAHPEYDEIVADLTRLANLLQKHAVEEDPWSLPYSIGNVARTIEAQTSVIKERQDLSQTNQLAMTQGDVEAVLECYRRLGALFRQLQADISLGIWDVAKEQQMDTRLKDLCPAYDAYHDAALPTSATARTGCTKDTRVDLLNTVQQWTRQEGASKIFWLSGMAGTGKTTIAYTLCEILQKAKQLGASFFCSRNSPDCRDVNRMVPTIAYQLGRYSNPYRKALYNALRNDPDAAKRKIDKQFEMLISKPLAEMGSAMPVDVVVVIDALDEVSDADGAQGVLNMLLGRADSLPIKFFVSSRPEPAISERMTTASGAMRSILWLHDIEQSLVQADIHTYLTEALSSIHATPVEIRQLAESSGSLFIFAATAVRYITLNKGLVDYKQRLRVVLNLHPCKGNIKYKGIDELYSTVLSGALDADVFEEDEIVPRQQVLWTVVCAREPLTMIGIAEVLDLLDTEAIKRAILPLQSVLHISEAAGVVSTLHASFPDFLLSKDRAGPFYCDNASHELHMVGCSFRIMNRSLRFNICDLESSHQLDRDVPNLQVRLTQKISTGLFYSCRYWSEHLTSNPLSTELLSLLESFLHSQLLFWMEVLNLKQKIGHGENVLSRVLLWLPRTGESKVLRDFICDARNFLTTFASNPTSLSTPHIYVSALPFTPTQSHVRKMYLPRMQGLIQIEGAIMEGRANSALATWDVGNRVNSIAQSSDGKRIASGASENGVSVWDASSGACVMGPLAGRKDWALSVAFSPDNTRIASGSTDCIIRLWDAQSGALLVEPLRGHIQPVYCVAFSPDGARLASGSVDGAVRLWDAYTGAEIGDAYTGHRNAVWSVAFSPNGEHLASGSEDWTVRVWGWQTGAAVRGPMKGHNDPVLSVAYSFDGLRLASGSYDCTVWVWDTPSGTLLVGPLKGHTGAVSSVSFSPDNTQIVSGSDDRTVRVWEAETGTLLAGPFEGHGRTINSVLYTLDGTRILSGSDDGTIRVWDARHRTIGTTKSLGHINFVALSSDGARVTSVSDNHTVQVWDAHTGARVAGPFTIHTEHLKSVAFSPDGARVVSCSSDETVHIWDAFTGTLLLGPIKGHSGPVNSVAFSPDGCRFASGSDDWTIRLWDSHTGESVAKPFEGHTEGVTSIAFSPDGARIASGSWDSIVRMWDANDGTALWSSYVYTDRVICVAFSSDGDRVLAGLRNGEILVLYARDGAELYIPPRRHIRSGCSIAFSPDGTHVVSGSSEKTVRVWDILSGTMVAGPLKGHIGDVSSVAFSPDGARIVSGSADGTIRLWDTAVATQSEARSWYDPFTSDGGSPGLADGATNDDETLGNFASGSADGTVRLWDSMAATQSGATLFPALSMNDDGWLTSSGSRLLVWVPSELRRDFSLPTPSNPVVINGNCASSIRRSKLLLGNRWHECFCVSPPPAL